MGSQRNLKGQKTDLGYNKKEHQKTLKKRNQMSHNNLQNQNKLQYKKNS